jgi:hypothetical protein
MNLRMKEINHSGAFRAKRFAGVLLALLPASAVSQITGSGSIQGVITDPSRSAIPNAQVTATHVGTGVKTERATTMTGFYVLSPLAPGDYTVEVSAQGFQTIVRQNITVDALSTVGLNLTMSIGSASESVTVTGAALLLNTSDASLGQTIRNEVYDALPLVMGNAPRDPTTFTQYLPGVSTSSATGNTAGNVFGAQDHSSEIYIEGLPITNPVVQGESRTLGLGVSVEAVDQFQIETAGAATMYNGQGAANFVLKSGTNQLHGDGFWYLRNTAFDARGFFAKTTPAEHQDEFGASLAGPIKRNHVFFFANYDGFRFTQGAQPTFFSIPTAAERAGNFSALPVPLYDPQSTDCSHGPCTRTPFTGNIIPPDRISSISGYFQSFLPPTVNGNLQNNYIGTVPVGYEDNSTTAKVDYYLDEKNTFLALFSRGHRSQTTPYRGQVLPLPYGETRLVDEIPVTAEAKYTRVVSPTLLNQLSYGFSRLNVPIADATIGGDYPNRAGLTGLPAGEAASAFPEIAWGGPNVPTNWRGTNARPFSEALNTFTLQDNVQWTRGRHSVTFGAQLQWLQANEKSRTYGNQATWQFSNSQTAGFNSAGVQQNTTGNAYASYLLGLVNSANVIQDSVVETGGRYKNYSWWVQDNIKVSARLNVNLGLRHDIWTPYVEVLDRESFLNPALLNPGAGKFPGALEFYGNGPGSCHCSSAVQTDHHNFGPRVGLAFSATSNTVIRAGYSIMYTHRGATGGRTGARTGTDVLGYSASPTFVSPDQGISPAFNWNNGVPPFQQPPFFDSSYGTGFNGTGATAASINYGDPSLGGVPPRYQNWNLSVEHGLPGSVVVGAAYVGSNGHFLGINTTGGGRSIWSDQIDPKYLALGSLLQATATPANLAAANQIIPGITLPFPTYTGSISQMLRPFPQYSGVTDLWGDVGNSNYNSAQVYINKRVSHGLTFNFNYVYAKGFDDTGANPVTGQTATSRTAYNWVTEKGPTQLPAHTFNLLFVYRLPFGSFVNHRVWRATLGGWQTSGIITYRSGMPIGTIAAACNLPNAGGCYANYNPSFAGPVRINGAYGSGDLLGANPPAFLDKNAFGSPAPFTYGSTPRTGVVGLGEPGSYEADLSLRREFAIREPLKVIFQADAINALNQVNFSPPPTNITSANFGEIAGQSNRPRELQLSARITF